MSAANQRTFKNEFNRVFRSAKRTLRRCVGWGPQKITDDAIGTQATQCAKFARFQQLYREYRNDPNRNVRDFMSQVMAAVDFFNMLPDTFDDICITPDVIDDIQKRIMLIKDIIYDLPTAPRYYSVLKTEMTFFVDFLYNLYMTKRLVCSSPYVSFASTTPRNSFSLPFPSWSPASLYRPASVASVAPLPLSVKNNEGNIQFYTGAVLRRAKNQRRAQRQSHTRKHRR